MSTDTSEIIAVLDSNRCFARLCRGSLTRNGARTRKQMLDAISRKERRAFRQGVELEHDVDHVTEAAFAFDSNLDAAGRDDLHNEWVAYMADLDSEWVADLMADEPGVVAELHGRDDDEGSGRWVVDPSYVEALEDAIANGWMGDEPDEDEAFAWAEAGWGDERFDADDIQWGFSIDSTLVRQTRSEFTRSVHRAPAAAWPYRQVPQRQR